VLQVFFHQADACLVTSNVFALACELNPQLRKELRVLADSPAVVPSVFFFRSGYVAKLRDQLEPAVVEMDQSPAGQEVLTVFQCDGMIKLPVACLNGSRQLLAEYSRAHARTVARTQAGSLPSLNQK
jgi:phosphonate transport system substrate-binding protein